MDFRLTLTLITLCGVVAGAVGTVGGQLWKQPVGDHQQSRRVSARQWFGIGVAVVGLIASIASELLRVSIRHSDEAREQEQATQKRNLREQEQRWRSDVKAMLGDAKRDIEENVINTIDGFQRTQRELQTTETQLLDSKHALLASNLEHTNTILLESQPLTSIAIRLRFSTEDSQLWDTMKHGQADIEDNANTSQGGFPYVPWDQQEYYSALEPLLVWLAQGPEKGALPGEPTEQSESTAGDRSIALLFPLDDTPNAVLPLGSRPYHSPDDEGERESAPKSAGILMEGYSEYSTAHVALTLAKSRKQGISTYSIAWDVDALTFAAAVDRANDAVASTSRLPSRLKVTILTDFEDLGLRDGRFSKSKATNLWRQEARDRQPLPTSRFRDMRLTMEVNGFREARYNYSLREMYSVQLLDKFDDELEVGCTVLEFARD